MTNYILSFWRKNTGYQRVYVLDIRDAPDVKIICEPATEGLGRMLCVLLNRNEREKDAAISRRSQAAGIPAPEQAPDQPSGDVGTPKNPEAH